GGLQLELPTLSGQAYSILRSTDAVHFQPWTNFTSSAAIGRCLDSGTPSPTGSFYRAVTAP
ncbi:MAG TPA: hypothetical protein VNZ22_12380, partial [Bacillota bacterium]|nr:hypothetical protein [Bacillota bacterium]